MYNTQSSGSPISKYCKAGRRITKTPHYAAGLGKSAPVLGSSWEIEADGTSQPCVGELGSSCWAWMEASLGTLRSTAGWVQDSLSLTRAMNTRLRHLICRKTTLEILVLKLLIFTFFFFLKAPITEVRSLHGNITAVKTILTHILV